MWYLSIYDGWACQNAVAKNKNAMKRKIKINYLPKAAPGSTEGLGSIHRVTVDITTDSRIVRLSPYPLPHYVLSAIILQSEASGSQPHFHRRLQKVKTVSKP